MYQFPPKFHCEILLNVSSGGKILVSLHLVVLLNWHLPLVLHTKSAMQILKQCIQHEKHVILSKQTNQLITNYLSVKSLLSLANPILLIGVVAYKSLENVTFDHFCIFLNFYFQVFS